MMPNRKTSGCGRQAAGKNHTKSGEPDTCVQLPRATYEAAKALSRRCNRSVEEVVDLAIAGYIAGGGDVHAIGTVAVLRTLQTLAINLSAVKVTNLALLDVAVEALVQRPPQQP
jgi:hypothetical protein